MDRQGFSVSDIGPIAITIVVAIVMVAVGAMVVGQFSESTYSTTTANLTFDNTTTIDVEGGLVSYLVYGNNTRDYLLASTNYTFDTTTNTVNVTDATARADVGGNEEIVWTYNAYTNATSTSQDGLTALSSFSGWFDTIVVVIIAVILLGLVYMLMNRRGSA